MSKNVKTGLISLMGALGLIALLIGIFTDAYSFGIGLVIAVAFWVGSGVLARFLGIEKEKTEVKETTEK